MVPLIRKAERADLESILRIYNQGIADRIATLEAEEKDIHYMKEWYENHGGRYAILVAELDGKVVGWASLNRYSNRCAYDGVADLSIYIERNHRGKGIGRILLQALEREAIQNGFHKIVLFTFPFNGMAQRLYRKSGYREVGVFKNQGILDGKFVDVMAMEKLLLPSLAETIGSETGFPKTKPEFVFPEPRIESSSETGLSKTKPQKGTSANGSPQKRSNQAKRSHPL